MSGQGAAGVFLYDGECGFCTASARFLRDRVRPSLDLRPWQEVDLAALGVTEAQCREAAALVTVDAAGTPMPARFGAEAIAAALRQGRGAWPAAGVLLAAPGVRALARGVYAVVARNRHRIRLPGQPGSSAADGMP